LYPRFGLLGLEPKEQIIVMLVFLLIFVILYFLAKEPDDKKFIIIGIIFDTFALYLCSLLNCLMAIRK